MTHTKRLKIDIGIASAGRRDLLAQTIGFLNTQTRQADTLMICPATPADLDESRLVDYDGPVKVVHGPIGSSPQRNTLMAHSDADFMIFFDDDFLPAPDFIAQTEAFLTKNADVAVLTGTVLADGITSQGFQFEEGYEILFNELKTKVSEDRTEYVYNGYGCNMIANLNLVREHNIRFDENLPLYAWLEDVDFSRQLAPFGKILKSDLILGVHLGNKRSGRSPGRRLGYSQVANPLYLAQKGTMEWSRAVTQVARNIAANSVKSFRPEAWVDRKGRLSGNILALGDILSGRFTPMRASKL